MKVKTHGKDGFTLGKQEVDLRYLEQIADIEQMAALGLILKYACEHLMDEKKTIHDIVQWIKKELDVKGLAFLADGGYVSGGYAMPRVQEIYSCFNRCRRK